ncbi:MAG: hypothetical protein WAV76_11035 [Bacteroidota bacterium]
MANKKSLEEQYPSVDLVYDIAKESYNVAMKRLDEANEGFEKLRSWVTVITFAFLAWIIPKAPANSYNILFFSAITIYITIICLTIYGKAKDGVMMPSPKKLYETRLHQDKWTFKKDFIYLAGEDDKKNDHYVIAKSKLATAIFIFFLLEAALFGFWLQANLIPLVKQ